MRQWCVPIVLSLLAAYSPSSAHALDLSWSGGQKDLAVVEARSCTLLVRAAAGEVLPQEWHLVWVGLSDSDTPLELLINGPSEDAADVCSKAQQLSALSLASHADTVWQCSSATRASIARYVLDVAAGSKIRIELVTANEGGTAPEGQEVSINGGAPLAYGPYVLSVRAVRSGDTIIFSIGGAHLEDSRVSFVADGSGIETPLDITFQSANTLAARMSLASKLPAGHVTLVDLNGFRSSIGIVGEAPPPQPAATNRFLVRFQPGQAEPSPGTTAGDLASFTFRSPALQQSLQDAGVARLERLLPSFRHSDVNGRNALGEPIHLEDLADLYVAYTIDTMSMPERRDRVAALEGVRYVAASQARATPFSNDPLFTQQWGLKNTGTTFCNVATASGFDINIDSAWTRTTGSQATRVAILDGGINFMHPDFESRVQLGPSFIDGETSADTACGSFMHGTSVAGIALASGDNSRGVAGVAWQGIPVALNVFSHSGDRGTPASVEAGIAWADAEEIPILNMSGGFYEDGGITSGDIKALNDICLNAFYHGRLFVAAMGNRDEQIRAYPAAFSRRVYGVGAVLQDGMRWQDSRLCFGCPPCDGSAYGSWIDLVAPGGAMIAALGMRHPLQGCPVEPYYDLTYCSSGCGRPFGGTSAGAPVIAGVASLVYSLNGNLLGEDIEQVLNRTARDITAFPGGPGWDAQTGYGMVNAGAALDFISPPRRVEQGSIGYLGTLGTLNVADSQVVTNRTFLHLGAGLPDTLFVPSCTRVHMRGPAQFQFPVAFSDTPSVWVRASGTTGWRDLAVFDYDEEVNWGQEVAGSRTASRDNLETYVFRIPNVGWFPAPPSEARIGFTAAGPEPTQVGVGAESVEAVTLALRTVPNPGAGVIVIDYRVPAIGPVQVTILDVGGRQVAKVVDGVFAGGAHVARWGGRASSGTACPPGVYFCRLEAGSLSLNKKFVFLGPGSR